MARYRKIPVTIDAEQWDGSVEGATRVIDWILSCDGTARFHDAPDNMQSLNQIAIDTLEGTMRAKPGDYIIKGVQGEFYPCDSGIFDQTYEAV